MMIRTKNKNIYVCLTAYCTSLSNAVVFRTESGITSGAVQIYYLQGYWENIQAGGSRPSRRSGHVVGFDAASNHMVW